MLNKRFIEFAVGIFMLLGIVAIFVLAFKVSGLSQYSSHSSFKVYAFFDTVGDLKVRAPVTIAGVRIGEVDYISLDKTTFRAKVVMLIDKRRTDLPVDTSAKILTAGLIGANYIELAPGFSDQALKDGNEITETHPAIILENLLGQFIYQVKDKDKGEDKDKAKL